MRASHLLMTAAFRALRLSWRLRRPEHRGALVALWHGERVLAVHQAYQELWTFPGGGVGANEWPQAAAARELREECGVVLAAHALRPALVTTHAWNFRRDRVHLFEARIDAEPALRLQVRELREARWVTAEELSALNIPPHLRDYLALRSKMRTGGSQAAAVVA